MRQSTLGDLNQGQQAVIDRIELPAPEARRLMEMGFLPGTAVVAAWRSPFGDPRVFRVDGSEVALRRETALHIILRAPEAVPNRA